jgi:excisionase family DNA binding protein
MSVAASNQDNTLPRLLSAKQVSAALGVSLSTVYDLAAKGLLASYRIGARGRGVLRFTEEMVSEYLAKNRHDNGAGEDHEPLKHLR